MKTPEQILREVGNGMISKSVATKAMKKYAKQWVEQVVREVADVPPNNMIEYYHLAIDQQ